MSRCSIDGGKEVSLAYRAEVEQWHTMGTMIYPALLGRFQDPGHTPESSKQSPFPLLTRPPVPRGCEVSGDHHSFPGSHMGLWPAHPHGSCHHSLSPLRCLSGEPFFCQDSQLLAAALLWPAAVYTETLEVAIASYPCPSHVPPQA